MGQVDASTWSGISPSLCQFGNSGLIIHHLSPENALKLLVKIHNNAVKVDDNCVKPTFYLVREQLIASEGAIELI